MCAVRMCFHSAKMAPHGSTYDVGNTVNNSDIIASVANDIIRSTDRNREVVLSVETLHRLLLGRQETFKRIFAISPLYVVLCLM
jgi:hypothetical protein